MRTATQFRGCPLSSTAAAALAGLMWFLAACAPPTPKVKLPPVIGPLKLTRVIVLPPDKQKHLLQTLIGIYGPPADSSKLTCYIYENLNAAYAAYFTKSMDFAHTRPGASNVRFLYDQQDVIHLARTEDGFYRQIFRKGKIVVEWQAPDTLAASTENELLNLALN